MANLNDELEQATATKAAAAALMEGATAARPTYSEIAAWCRNYVAQTLGVSTEKVDVNAEFEALGFDSAAAVALVVDVGTWLDLYLEPATLFEFPTISAFAEYLAKQ
jgi:acyl carrier protein